MAVGALLSADYQWEFNSTQLYGGAAGTGGLWLQYGQSIEGLGTPETKTADVSLYGRHGSYANPDFYDPRVITIPVLSRGTPTAAMTAMGTVTKSVWAPTAADVSLAFQLPGLGKFYVMGRPRGAKTDLSYMNRGVVLALLRFDCLDPTISPVT